MIAKSCRKIEVLVAAHAIMGYVGAAKEPVSVTDVARATGLSVDSCFRQMGTMEELGWVRKIGDAYLLGMGLALIWARKKSMLEGERDGIDKDLKSLEDES
jgi:DNA-binding IclR family transcriptional regulator